MYGLDAWEDSVYTTGTGALDRCGKEAFRLRAEGCQQGALMGSGASMGTSATARQENNGTGLSSLYRHHGRE